MLVWPSPPRGPPVTVPVLISAGYRPAAPAGGRGGNHATASPPASEGSGQVTVPGSGTTGTWLDETDIRPTLLYLTGLRDDYQSDGRVITQILTNASSALRPAAVTALGACYKQLNSSVGEFGTATLQAATKAAESTSPSDTTYTCTDSALSALEQARDHLAEVIKGELSAAAFQNRPVPAAAVQTAACQAIVTAAEHLSASS